MLELRAAYSKKRYRFKIEMIKKALTILVVLLSATGFSQPNCVYMADDIYPGSYGSTPVLITEFNGALYFRCTGNASGPELWKYENGVSSMVADINPGVGGSMPNQFVVMGSNLYFSAFVVGTGLELYKYDGTTVSLAADIQPGSAGSSISFLTVVDSELYFTADDGVNGMEPWKYDGTTASLVADLNPGPASSNTDEYVGAGGFVYFTGIHPTLGFELWKYDGTTAVVQDLYPGANGSDLGELTAVGSKICFRATNGTQGYELWSHDGTSATCLDVCTVGPGDFTPWEFTAFGNAVYFRGFITGSGYELWKYDGTNATMVADIFAGGGNAHPNHLTAANTVMYFAANNGSAGNELWMTDGTTASLVGDIKTGAGDAIQVSGADKFETVGDQVFLMADDGTSGNEIWWYDGTTLEFSKDIIPGSGTANPSELTAFGNSLFFMADNITNGGELWEWDLNQDLTDSISVATCNSYVSPAGTVYSVDGVYDFVDIVPSVNCPGCDSLVTVHLVLSDPYDSLVIYTCDDYLSPAGNLYTAAGNYVFTDTIFSINCPGLDSIIDVDLTILTSLNTAVFVTQGVIFVVQPGGTYQWLDCDAGYAPIPGEIDQDFLPTVDGNYACQISIGSCIDTTSCEYVESTFGVGLTANIKEEISIYPNPVSGKLTISSNSSKLSVSIFNVKGKEIFQSLDQQTDEMQIDMSEYAKGIYHLIITTDTESYVKRVIKE